ncbi:phosphonate ABC transporter, permease protein PhnE [Bremerella sp. JC817]|uniref:phosphonate ABC transporter, permease protein PhnE n=1 Tax=Bremerella sp. JC817 TaxID=3231756 RepID=UPI00345A7DB8
MDAAKQDRDHSADVADLRQSGWPIRQPIVIPKLLCVVALVAVAAMSFRRVGLEHVRQESTNAFWAMLGHGESSQVLEAAQRFAQQGWPPVISRQQEVSRIENFNPDQLPWFSHLESKQTTKMSVEFVDGQVIEREETIEEQVLVEHVGYLVRVGWLMLETLEIALWGTILALLLGVPLSLLGSRRISIAAPIVYAARTLCSLSRAIPELVSAMFFVLLFGFGPAAGVLALGLHSAGFLGKFFADDMDNTDPAPAQALASSGVGRIGVFLHALLPQVFPQYLAYIQYILERNVRTATVLGIVGAGGIGVELMGKWSNFQYGHATTVLLAIFFTVVVLELLTQSMRKKLIQD